MKLFNNVYGECFVAERPLEHGFPIDRHEGHTRGAPDAPRVDGLASEHLPRLTGVGQEETRESDYGFDGFLDDEADLENVDVQAILFYGYTGRRCFPTVKAL